MAETYKKDGDRLQISEDTVKTESFTYEHIEAQVAHYEGKLAYWNNLKVEADNLGLVSKL